MAFATSLISPSTLITTTRCTKPLTIQRHDINHLSLKKNRTVHSLTVKAAKLPAGVEVPKVQPKFKPLFLGFTNIAEIWNSRACMIGLIGNFIVELILHKGILELIGVEVGKGLDIPL